SVERWAGMINRLAKEIPPRRERLLHIGLFGYARGMGGKRLPRAIAFDAALYSIGIPPEFIGTGRGLMAAQRAGLLPVLETFYVNLRRDLIAAGHYLNRENLTFLIRQDPSWALLQEDVEAIETILKIEIGPKTADHYHHRNLVSSAYLRWRDGEPIADQVLEAAKIRGGLG
ncbi:MAG: phosphoenolpyruvate carboxylase, partial [Proteobacteria bacterium]|nr:phosphoenolpyruvate carboxylase [Pseudomonadota bacterium]